MSLPGAPSVTLATVPNETTQVRIRKDLLLPAKVAAVSSGVTLEAWLNRAVEDALKREADAAPVR